MTTFEIFMAICIGICAMALIIMLGWGTVMAWQDRERIPAIVFFMLMVGAMLGFGTIQVRMIWAG